MVLSAAVAFSLVKAELAPEQSGTHSWRSSVAKLTTSLLVFFAKLPRPELTLSTTSSLCVSEVSGVSYDEEGDV